VDFIADRDDGDHQYAKMENRMQIYVLRHGLAEEGRPGMRDADRALLPEGKKKLREVLRVARSVGVVPTLILTSPYRRALETAEIAAEALGHAEKLIESKVLVPASRPEAVWDEIRQHKDADAVMLVGHEPLLSQLIAYLLAAPTLQIDLKKGALVRVDMDQVGTQPHGTLKWLVIPKLATA
jgi:phosphohistidine phosphatase